MNFLKQGKCLIIRSTHYSLFDYHFKQQEKCCVPVKISIQDMIDNLLKYSKNHHFFNLKSINIKSPTLYIDTTVKVGFFYIM